MNSRRVAVVPHTHWDREWYEPFQTFRLRLVDLLDELIPLLENDPSYARYLLDGQMAVIDDYLEVRPEMAERLRRLAASGRVSVGPWYILVDEFLVSGETIIRDLQLGIEKGAAFGGVAPVGYLPDMFGHIAQMPQILQQAGFGHTVLWRGVPSAITKTGFNWVAPDGTAVRAEYLTTGYGNGASLPMDAKALVRRVNDHLADVGSFLLGDLLYMNGSDHLLPQRHLGRVIAEANAVQDELRFDVTSIAEYLQTAPTEGLETWHGELRSGFRSNILMGVLSNRVDVKHAASVTERHMERRAEPYSALFAAPDQYPDALLRLAWREIIRNAAHDSICACSVDDTVDAVLHRFSEARQIAAGVAKRALDSLAQSLRDPGVYVVNARATSRSGLVEAIVTGDEFDSATMQLIDQRGNFPDSMLLDASAMRSILSIIQGTRIDDNAWVHSAELGQDGDVLTLNVTVGAHELPGVELAEAREQLMNRLAAEPELRTRVTLAQPPIRRVVGRVENVPALGWSPFAASVPEHAVHQVGEFGLSNELVDLEVDVTNGTFAVNGLGGFGRLVDVGDLGDSYNYSPPAIDRLIEAPNTVSVAVLESGPLRGRVAITSNYEWPERIDAFSQQRTGTVSVPVTTVVELRADETTVRVETSFINPARDHRLRVHLPLPSAATTSRAECAFTAVERGLTAEGRSEEFGLPTFPSRRWVQAGALTVVHEGLHEYELVAIADGSAHELALTLLRATGMLSRLGMSYRPLPAGPLTPVEGLQMVGSTITGHYAIVVGPCDPYQVADDVLVPLETIGAAGGGTRVPEGSALDVRGAEVSAVRRVEGVLEVRVFNPRDTLVRVEVPNQRGWLVDLKGRGLELFEGSFELRANGIATFRLLTTS
jgi:mannosylglycerate hydrolase